MADQNEWQSPGSATGSGAPAGPQPGWIRPPGGDPGANWSPPPGSPGQGWGPPPGAANPSLSPNAAHQSGWVPPPKPGLVPLRPLGLGTILSASFQVLRRNPRPTFGFSLLVQAVTMVASLALTGVVTVVAFERISTAEPSELDAIAAGSTAAIMLSVLVPVLLSIAALGLIQGIISLEVARGTVGEKLRLRGLWRRARGRILALVVWMLLIAVGAMLALGIILVAFMVLAFSATLAGMVAGFAFATFVGLGLAAVGLWLGAKLCLVPSALVLERLSLGGAIRRSWRLVQGHFWRVLGIQLLVNLIILIAGQVITFPISMVLILAGGLLGPTGDPGTFLTVIGISYLITIVVSVVYAAATSVVQAATSALLYIDLRMRKEGLDLELARFVEARQAGQETPDPYLYLRPAHHVPGAQANSPWV